ncbi:MAG: polyribonucleotide nucleotidyltransferase [Candidatus Paceibacterota bacterium]
MLNQKVFETEFAGKKLSFETSDLAGQANASVIGRYGDSAILVTVVMDSKDVDLPYFPLRIEYQERFYAAGRIMGARFIRREGRPSDESILAGRVIDRTVRPLFDDKLRREIQVVITPLSLDPEQESDFLGLITTSVALSISNVPWAGPVAGVKLTHKDGKLLINANKPSLPKSIDAVEVKDEFEFDAFVAGTKEKINMIELEGIDAKEENIQAAFEAAQKEIATLVAFQEKIVKEIGKPKEEVAFKDLTEENKQKISAFVTAEKIDAAIYCEDNSERTKNIKGIEEELAAHLEAEGVDEGQRAFANGFVDKLIDKRMHERILAEEKRVDSRPLDQIRTLYSEVGLFARTHGSAFFSRGTTQSLAITTIAPPGQDQIVENTFKVGKNRFMLHYNFPPYSVGEVGMFRGAGRREVGHGALAKKALENMMPSLEDFPYAVRTVSEIVSSNGSSSMATVCASTLSLLDAGVPLKKPVAGIAMGLISSEDASQYKILTDIQGPEDHFGDADFKVAGTSEGVTAMQMDVKIEGLTAPMLKDAMEASKKARLQILEHMKATLAAPKELSQYAPLILKTRIPVDKIGELIGPGGKNINGIIASTGALAIDIEEDGLVFISADNQEAGKAALKQVEMIAREFQVGEIIEGPISRILEFGAIVDFGGGRDGMIHVSELKNGFVKNVTDVVKEGQVVKAKIIKVEGGKIGLSMKALEPKKEEPKK